MNLDKKILTKVYRTLASFVNTSSNIINGDRIFMKADKGNLIFQYFNGDLICRCTMACESDEAFSCQVRLRCIGEASKFRGNVDMSIENRLITLTDGISSIMEKVCDWNGEDQIPTYEHTDDNTITVNTKDFCDILKCIKNIQHISPLHSGQSQLFLKYSNNKLKAVSKTGVLIAQKTIAAAGKPDVIWYGVLNKKYIDLIKNVSSDKLTLYIHHNCFEVESDGIYMCILLSLGHIEDNDINLEMNTASSFSLSVDDVLLKLDELAFLEEAKLNCKSGEDGKIIFSVTKGNNQMSCTNALSDYTGDAFDFKIDFKKLYDLLQGVYHSPILIFKYSPDLSGIIFFSEDKSFNGMIALEK